VPQALREFVAAARTAEPLLLPHFDCVEDAPVSDSIAVFAGKERSMMWRRRF
jgi:hypothetical protein